MGFFKKIGKLAKKKLSFKNMIKMANPLNHINPLKHLKQTREDLRDVKGLFQNDGINPHNQPRRSMFGRRH